MTPEQFDKLTLSDFENERVMERIRYSLKELQK